MFHDLKGIGMETSCILGGLYDHSFVTYILQMLNEGTMIGWQTSHLIPFQCTLCYQVESNCSHCNCYTSDKLWQCGSLWWHIHSILDVP
jgi:hypothetical protein